MSPRERRITGWSLVVGLMVSGVFAVIPAGSYALIVGAGFAFSTALTLAWTYWPMIRLRLFRRWRQRTEAVANAVQWVLRESTLAFENPRTSWAGHEIQLQRALKALRSALRHCEIRGSEEVWDLCERFDEVLAWYLRDEPEHLQEERPQIVLGLERWADWVERDLLLRPPPAGRSSTTEPG